MNRRDFLRAATSGAAAWGVGASLPVFPEQDEPAEGIIPEDKGLDAKELAALRRRGERRVFRGAERSAIGMPIGGICAGQVYLLGDGTLGGWHVDGRRNFTGYGATCYEPRKIERELHQGFLLETRFAPEGEYRRGMLADVENGGDYDDIEFIGEYPIGEVRYLATEERRKERKLPPVRATLRAYSPFLPLNAADSSLPCTVLRFELVNESTETILGVLTGFLENGVERDALDQVGAPRWRNRAAYDPITRDLVPNTILMEAIPPARDRDQSEPRPERMLQDFEGDDYGDWTVEGTAFGDGPAKGTLPNQQEVSGFKGAGLVNTYLGGDRPTGTLTSPPFTIDRRYLSMLVGGGGHPNETCVDLLLDGEVVRTAMGKEAEKLEPVLWDLGEYEGREAVLRIVDRTGIGWGHVNVDHIVLTDELPEELERPKPTDLTYGTMALSGLGRGREVVDWKDDGKLDNESGERPGQITTDRPATAGIQEGFVLYPGRRTEIVFVVSWHFPNLHTGHRTHYSTRFANAAEVARYVIEHDERLWRETELFRKTAYEDTTLPWWLALRLFMPVANLATGTAQWWDDGRFWGWEGVGCCSGTCTHVWNYSHAEARLFPQLARSTRVMQDLGTAFEEATGRVAFRGEVDRGFAYAADGQAGTVLKCYREHLTSADGGFLRENWPRIRQVLEYQIGKDAELSEDGEPDGVLITSQHNTYDIDFYGPNTMVGSMYLASLLAGARMAERVGDETSAKRYRRLYRSGRQKSEATLFNDEYFVQRIPEGDRHPYQYGTGCLSDQLFGQTWARLLDLGTVYDEGMIGSALASIYRHNFVPEVGPYNEVWPPERFFARDHDAGLLLCTWPRGGRPDKPVRYKDEVWSGIEYQVATSMVWEGLVDEALVICKAIDDRYDGRLHNPWNEVECGDHYARAMASYGVLQALEGFVYDGPAERIGMAPRLTPERFAAFFAGAEGWGLLSQAGNENEQTNRVDLHAGTLRVREIVAVPISGRTDGACDARVLLDRRTLPANARWEKERAVVELDETVIVRAGQTLEVEWEW